MEPTTAATVAPDGRTAVVACEGSARPRARPGERGGAAHAAPHPSTSYGFGSARMGGGRRRRGGMRRASRSGTPRPEPRSTSWPRAPRTPPSSRATAARWSTSLSRPVPVPRGPVLAARQGAAVGDPVLSGLGRLLAGREVRGAGALAGGRASPRCRDAAGRWPRLQDPDADRARWLGITADGGEAGGDRAILQGDPRLGPAADRPAARRPSACGTNWSRPPGRGPTPRTARSVEIVADVAAAARLAGGAQVRARRSTGIDERMAENPDEPDECNSLAWAYLIAPPPLRDPDQALAMARKAVRTEPKNPIIPQYSGRGLLSHGPVSRGDGTCSASDLEGQEDRVLAWDLCFLAMSYHRPRGGGPGSGVSELGPSMVAGPEGPLGRGPSRAVRHPG